MRSFVLELHLLVLIFLVIGCSGAKLSQTSREKYAGPPINSIALAPGGGPFADAIGVELFNHGLIVIDPEQTMELVGRLGLTDIQIATNESYDFLRDAGIDALLVVKAIMAADGTPESASVRLSSTYTYEVVAGLTWQNGRGGRRGSIADRTMRKNLADAAAQISVALVERIGR